MRDKSSNAARKAAPVCIANVRSASKAGTGGDGQPSGWDPAEVWRTRVRDVRDRKRRDKGSREEG